MKTLEMLFPNFAPVFPLKMRHWDGTVAGRRIKEVNMAQNRLLGFHKTNIQVRKIAFMGAYVEK